jgi:mono/diheme cytochrome c family protein
MRLLLLLAVPAAIWAADISGTVRDSAGPVAGATVRVQGTSVATRTGAGGEFSISARPDAVLVALTAYAPGYYIAGPVIARPGDRNVALTFKKHNTDDDATYEWLSAFSAPGRDSACQNCHAEPGQPASRLPFDEWVRDAHGASAGNRRFLSMYNGTDLSGENRSPATRYFYNKDYGRVPLPPDPALPYFGPGFKLDFPESAGNCAACHLPAAAVRGAYETDPNEVKGVGKEGVACDVCHKLWSVRFNPSTGLPYPNTPGVLSMEFRRPAAGHQLFLGPYDDVAPGDDSFSPLQRQSQICAPCHFAQFWGVQVYNSFGEWLDSPYADPSGGMTCQDCHMPTARATRIARADKGALPRDPNTIFSHLMPGAADDALLRDAADLTVKVERGGAGIYVYAWVTNSRTGHHLPTDHPARNVLLVVSARSAGRDLPLHLGPVVPEWGGRGDAPEDYAGRPGRGYAKILEELWTEVSPTAAYWNPTVLRQDTRLAAFSTDYSCYEFPLEADAPVEVTARLIFRRAFRTLVQQKSWTDPDILMAERLVELR